MIPFSQDSISCGMYTINQGKAEMLLRQLEISENILNLCVNGIIKFLLLETACLKEANQLNINLHLTTTSWLADSNQSRPDRITTAGPGFTCRSFSEQLIKSPQAQAQPISRSDFSRMFRPSSSCSSTIVKGASSRTVLA